MDAREQLEELHLALEGAVDQMSRAQRLTTDDVRQRLERCFAEIVALRNEVRERLMKELARGPKKLPVV